MWLGLQPLCNLADRSPFATRETLCVQEHLVLEHGDALGARGVFTEAKKAARPVPELGRRFEALLVDGSSDGGHVRR